MATWHGWSVLGGVATLAVMAVPAQAVSFTVNNVGGTWSNVQGTTVFNGVGTDQVRWGDPATLAGQSGLGFQSAIPPQLTITSGSNFVLGQLTHFNFPVWSGTAASGVDLSISMEIDGILQSFGYSFTIDETLNLAGSCPVFQITTTPCDDKIDFTSPFSSTTFARAGTNYTLELLGFSSTFDGLSPVSSFITEENRASSAFLVARVIKDPASEPEPEAVPEPAIALGLLVAGASLIRRRR